MRMKAIERPGHGLRPRLPASRTPQTDQGTRTSCCCSWPMRGAVSAEVRQQHRERSRPPEMMQDVAHVDPARIPVAGAAVAAADGHNALMIGPVTSSSVKAKKTALSWGEPAWRRWDETHKSFVMNRDGVFGRDRRSAHAAGGVCRGPQDADPSMAGMGQGGQGQAVMRCWKGRRRDGHGAQRKGEVGRSIDRPA